MILTTGVYDAAAQPLIDMAIRMLESSDDSYYHKGMIEAANEQLREAGFTIKLVQAERNKYRRPSQRVKLTVEMFTKAVAEGVDKLSGVPDCMMGEASKPTWDYEKILGKEGDQIYTFTIDKLTT